jgi:hypothetical protein
MKPRWKILIALGAFLILLAVSLTVTMHVQPENELEAYKKTLRDKGEKLELSEVIPPPVAPESNSVNAVQDAFRMFGSGAENIPYAMQMVAPGKALIGWRQPDVRGFDFTNSWEEFAVGVEADRPAIELLHEVLERPKLDFQLDYKKGATLLLPHLAPLKRSTQKLDAAAVYELHNGDSGAAATNILTILALVHDNADEGLLITHLVRIAMAAIAINPTWELLQATNVTDAQLAAVQKGWEQMDFLSDAENSFTMERAWMPAEIQKSRASHEGFQEMFVGSSFGSSSSGGSSWADVLADYTKGPRLATAEMLWRSSWSYSAELHSLKTGQVILETLRTMQTNQSQFYKADYDAMVTHLTSLGSTNFNYAIYALLQFPNWHEFFGDMALSTAVRKTLQIETERRVVITAIALKRFQLKHGKWPDALNELVPEFLPSVPIDPYDGKPLKYHPNTDGTFLLYSIGEDGVDDGGDATSAKPSLSGTPNWYWQRGRDLVWPQPASSAEVQNFYEHPPK